jgi:hypothetical protein
MDLINRQNLKNAKFERVINEYTLGWNDAVDAIIQNEPSAKPEIIRCKDCRFDRACTHTMMRKPRGGGIIYCSVEYCSEAERKDNGDFDMMRGEK